jgi:hypothetical protein
VLGQPGRDQTAAGLAAADAMVDRITGHSRRQVRAIPDLRDRTLAPGTGPRIHRLRPHVRHRPMSTNHHMRGLQQGLPPACRRCGSGERRQPDSRLDGRRTGSSRREFAPVFFDACGCPAPGLSRRLPRARVRSAASTRSSR